MTVPFVVNRASPVPLHRQIYQQWRSAILDRRFRRGERVPSTRAFAETYGVSRVTVTAAYEQLLAEGYFETRTGAGTFVSSELPDDVLQPVRVAASRAPASAVRLSRFSTRLGSIRQLPSSALPLNLSNVSPDVARFPFALWRRRPISRGREPYDAPPTKSSSSADRSRRSTCVRGSSSIPATKSR